MMSQDSAVLNARRWRRFRLMVDVPLVREAQQLNGRGDTHQICPLLKVKSAVPLRCRDFSI
jgi:hypothetical protein